MHRLWVAGLLPVSLIASAFAQPLDLPAPVVTEAAFLAALDADHPAVVEVGEAVAVARARVVSAATLENPELGLAREDLRGPAEQDEWTLSWQLPEPGRGLRIEARQAAVAAAEAGGSVDRISLRLEMRAIYAEWAVASARRERLAIQAARVDELAARERRRAVSGEVSGLEARRLALAAAALRSRLALAASSAEAARARARGWHPDLPPDAEPVLPPLPPLAGAADEAPSLRAAGRELEAALLEQRAAGRFVASPELEAGWLRETTGVGTVEGPVLGVSWSLPLLSRRQGERALAEARVRAARARLERARREVDAAWAASAASYRRVTDELAALSAVLAGNEKLLVAAESAFRQGELPLTDLLETLRSVAESETAALDLHAAALAAHRELERLSSSTASRFDPISTEP